MDRLLLIQTLARSLQRIVRLLAGVCLALLLALAYAHYIEARWIRVRHVSLAEHPSVTLVHISDIHYDGDAAYLEKAVRIINGLDASAVCFTGDLVEEARFVPGALRILGRLNKPLYGILGNHDYWAQVPQSVIADAFSRTGGGLLPGDQAFVPKDKVAGKGVFLLHYPNQIDLTNRYDLVMAGHTHGGQLGQPFRGLWGADLAPYDIGLFRTPAGPLYVNPGLGTFWFKVRFLCRPEITVIGF